MSEVKEIEIAKIRQSKLNPRLEIASRELDELSESIREVGVLPRHYPA